jgi:hypothetical protein
LGKGRGQILQLINIEKVVPRGGEDWDAGALLHPRGFAMPAGTQMVSLSFEVKDIKRRSVQNTVDIENIGCEIITYFFNFQIMYFPFPADR